MFKPFLCIHKLKSYLWYIYTYIWEMHYNISITIRPHEHTFLSCKFWLLSDNTTCRITIDSGAGPIQYLWNNNRESVENHFTLVSVVHDLGILCLWTTGNMRCFFGVYRFKKCKFTKLDSYYKLYCIYIYIFKYLLIVKHAHMCIQYKLIVNTQWYYIILHNIR